MQRTLESSVCLGVLAACVEAERVGYSIGWKLHVTGVADLTDIVEGSGLNFLRRRGLARSCGKRNQGVLRSEVDQQGDSGESAE